MKNDITFLKGKAGSGKTLLACYVGLELFLNNMIEKIVIVRPTIAPKSSEIGYLPGNLEEKMLPWMQPIIQNFYKLRDKKFIDGLQRDGYIEILPVTFTRGITYTDAFVIVDEAQNVDINSMFLILTRIGKKSKITLCGDSDQIDLKYEKDSGLNYFCDFDIKGIVSIELLQNHRLPIVDEIVNLHKFYKEIENRTP